MIANSTDWDILLLGSNSFLKAAIPAFKESIRSPDIELDVSTTRTIGILSSAECAGQLFFSKFGGRECVVGDLESNGVDVPWLS
ncbi:MULTISPECIES: hypothetical protein [Okeania]|uniref:hypothetical protein n=1 Tax=Okeania TaxID=1458928 RepID=UPI000F523200|nr:MULTISPECIES: hypothetical protein [Okeania]NES90996.1 hypothetical protein [Okeania sp. SIO2B9]NET13205.1 hypothetical protein [Okeania sp. SIO1H6]NEP75445.1 hypothetical protein [Okeania sp. SIO2G5]NEP96543.1 hypothetical protein [Okeania sp. SIO2F5]NEQ94314.1 hypothetical protein [Okeania sp. SIO2G4]